MTSGDGAPGRTPVVSVRTVPGWAVRILFAVVALTVLFTGVPAAPWTAIGTLLVGVAVWRPRSMTAWVVGGALMLSSLVEPGTLTVRLLVLVAGVHALHVIGSWMLAVPAAARLQPGVLLSSLRRYVLIQVPVQAAAAILLLAGARGPIPVLPVVSGLAIVALAVLLLPSLLRRPPR